MIRNQNLSEWMSAAKHGVTSTLPLHLESHAFQHAYELAAG